jgi:hypothetical protein
MFNSSWVLFSADIVQGCYKSCSHQ